MNVALTASGKERSLVAFYTQLKRDGWNVSQLAAAAGVNRPYLTRILGGHETGETIWPKILPLLSEAALLHAQQCSAWNIYAARARAWVCHLRARNAEVRTCDGEFGRVCYLERQLISP